MKKTIYKIGTAGILSLFLFSHCFADEVAKKDKNFFDTYVPLAHTVSDKEYPIDLPEQNTSSNATEVQVKENKGFFGSYIAGTQTLLSKGVGFFSSNFNFNKTENKEESFLQKYANVTSSVLNKGIDYLGVPYRWGGNHVNGGFDCSGFVRAVFQNSVGFTLPRTAKEMSQVGQKISVESLKPGDLVFFNTMRRTFSHVGIYLGENRFMHSPRKGQRVRVDNMEESYWTARFTGARRIIDKDMVEDISSESNIKIN